MNKYLTFFLTLLLIFVKSQTLNITYKNLNFEISSRYNAYNPSILKIENDYKDYYRINKIKDYKIDLKIPSNNETMVMYEKDCRNLLNLVVQKMDFPIKNNLLDDVSLQEKFLKFHKPLIKQMIDNIRDSKDISVSNYQEPHFININNLNIIYYQFKLTNKNQKKIHHIYTIINNEESYIIEFENDEVCDKEMIEINKDFFKTLKVIN